MPTPSELLRNSLRRSIFGNYQAANGDLASSPAGSGQATVRASSQAGAPTLQVAIDTAIARAFIYRFLAKAFEDGEPESWRWLTKEQTKQSLAAAIRVLAGQSQDAQGRLGPALRQLDQTFTPTESESFSQAYLTCFGHTVRGDCPMNEIEYGDIKADPLFQPHRLSDLSAFYHAFGLEVAPNAAERVDHISIELEFMSVLAAKEAYALEHQFDDQNVVLLRDAQKKFLREHLGRWTPAFTRRLARMADSTPLGALARLTCDFVLAECALYNVPPGSEDLLLRPVDQTGESLCASCGISSLPPGATATGAI